MNRCDHGLFQGSFGQVEKGRAQEDGEHAGVRQVRKDGRGTLFEKIVERLIVAGLDGGKRQLWTDLSLEPFIAAVASSI